MPIKNKEKDTPSLENRIREELRDEFFKKFGYFVKSGRAKTTSETHEIINFWLDKMDSLASDIREEMIPPKEITSMRFERDQEGDFLNCKIYFGEKVVYFPIEKTEINLIPTKLGSYFDIFLSSLNKED